MSAPPTSPSEPLALPLEDILLDVTRSLVDAQQALDSASLEAELHIRDSGLDKLGLVAHWYAIPELAFDLRLAFAVDERGRLVSHLADAQYQSRYGFALEASSLLHTRIQTVPPGQVAEMRLLDPREVLQRVGQIRRVVEAYDRADNPFFALKYRPLTREAYGGGSWFVLLLNALSGGGVNLVALAALDDATGVVQRLWTDAELHSVTLHSVTFTADQAADALDVILGASAETLQYRVRLTQPVVSGILAARDAGRRFGSLAAAVGGVPNLGPASLRRLLAYVTGGALGPVTVEGVAFTAEQAQAALVVVNTEGQETLRLAVGLSAPLVSGILAYREERPFDNLGALGALPYAGKTAMEKLRAFVSGGEIGPGTIEGVAFTPAQSGQVLELVNQGTPLVLRAEVGLPQRVVDGILAARPIGTVGALGGIDYVGPAMLLKLLDFVTGGRQNPVTIEGITFTVQQAADAVDVVNTAAQETLELLVGLGSSLVERILGGRPFESLHALDEGVRGLGASALGKLRDYVLGEAGAP